MPRAMWSGAISFGLVTIPVRLFGAVSTKSIRFNQIDTRTDARVKRKWVSAADGSDVANEDIVKGYELGNGRFVTVTEDELAALDPDASRSIDIVEFVDGAEIDPVYYDSPYYLAPDELGAKAYRLLAEALERENKVAIARFVMRNRQYLAAIRSSRGALVLSTMNYADEVRSADEIDDLERVADIEVSDAELTMASQLIDSLTTSFEPGKFTDTYRERVTELIEAKAAGETFEAGESATPSSDELVDLMAALEASVAAAKESRKSA
ncbi:MAG: Ku protein [Acidimicrobiales bacterium]